MEELGFTSNIILELFKKEGKPYVRFLFNNEEKLVFDGKKSAVTSLENFSKILDEHIDTNFDENCGNEWTIQKSDSKVYLIFWLISFFILVGLVVYYAYLRKKEKERELNENLDQERLIL